MGCRGAGTADGALFSELDRGECYSRYTSTLYSYRVGAIDPGAGAFEGYVLGIAKDGKALYVLQAPKQEGPEQGPGCSRALPCELERVAEPRLVADDQVRL